MTYSIGLIHVVLQTRCTFTNYTDTCKQGLVYFNDKIKLSIFNAFAIGSNESSTFGPMIGTFSLT